MATFTSVDGALIEISGENLSVKQYGATTFGVWTDELSYREFAIGALEFGEIVARREELALTEEYTLLNGHKLRTGTRTATDHVTKVDVTTVLGVWVGAEFSAHAWIESGEASQTPEVLTTRIIALFNQFMFTETDTGVVMKPVAGSNFSLVRDANNAPDLATYVDGLGLVNAFERTREQEFLVPRTPGERVAGGRLWVEGPTLDSAERAEAPEDLPADPNLTLLLVSDTAITRINPALDEVSESSVLDRSSALTVQWAVGAFS